MQVASPLAGTVRQVIKNSSCIPHLRHHILSRARQRQDLSVNSVEWRRPRRHYASVTLTAEDLYGDNEHASYTTSKEKDSIPTANSLSETTPTEELGPVIRRNTILKDAYPLSDTISPTAAQNDILNDGTPECILQWLTCCNSGKSFTATASQEDFAKAYCALDPEVLLDPIKELRKNPRDYPQSPVNWPHAPSVVRFLVRYEDLLDGILTRRREAKRPLDLSVCRHALRLAAASGNRRAAEYIWNAIMPQEKIAPDIACYNYLLQAFIWNLMYGQQASISTRNTDRVLKLRSQTNRPKVYRNYSVDVAFPATDTSLRSQALKLFQALTEQGLEPNESTFCQIMLAMARAGDISGFESILKSVWNVDIHMLQSYDEEEIESPTFYDQGHALRPSKELLTTVVHCYCINSEHEKATQTLDFLSRNYALDIPLHVWSDIFEWTFILGVRRGRNSTAQGQQKGLIPLEKLDELHAKITDYPYSIRPTAAMQDLMIRSAIRRSRSRDTASGIRTSISALHNQLEHLTSSVRALSKYLFSGRRFQNHGVIVPDLYRMIRELNDNFLRARQQYHHIGINAYTLLSMHRKGHSDGLSRTAGAIPTFIEEFREYLPTECKYSTKTGTVSLRIRDDLEDRDVGLVRVMRRASPWWRLLCEADVEDLMTNLEVIRSKGSAERAWSEHYRPMKIAAREGPPAEQVDAAEVESR